jgi:ABC-2 type transport system ATP-binding protein
MTATTAGSGDCAVRVTGLRKRYGGVAALDGIDLRVRRGEIFAVLGPNGAGKTTAVEILEGYRSRDGGDVSVLGADPARAGRPWRARIGVVSQSEPAATELTVREIVTHFSAYYPKGSDPDEVIAAVGLSGRAGVRLRRLSGGQRRRVDVALGIVGSPELLFLDEPTTGFDPQARRQFWELVKSLAGGGMTVVLTTHYLDEAEALAGQVAVLSAGRIVATGTPAELGGGQAAAATVSWRGADGQHAVVTDTPTSYIAGLARRTPGEIPGLTVTRPSLEDRYLDLITQNGAPR